jgi:phosphate transport system permease protein
MATIELQTTAELAESRRKMQAKRRMKNRIALTLSMATMAFGLFWLIWILMSTVTRGIDGMSLALFTEMTPPPNTAGGGLANALAGSGLLILWATVSVRRWAFWRGFIWRNMAVSPAGGSDSFY